MRILLLALMVVLLAGCPGPIGVAVKRDPVPENCEALCRTPCTLDPAIKFDPPPGDTRAFDTLTEQVVAPLRSEFDRCELHRVSCVQCLDRLKTEGVTK